ncbi:MAG: type IX secretion system membrane protein PorP/SprF [Saprospiraceae bacterium]|nr:type IX secretion system membrane protein PorP/SprF [Saprospiraceae bacterium]
MKKIWIPLVLLAFGLSASAQQEHQYTQWMYNKLLINPAYAGVRGTPTVTGIFRSQWLGFEGAPQSGLLSFNSPFLSDRVGVGAVISSNKIGFQRDFQVNIAYSYDLIAQENVSLRLGVMGSLRSLSVDYSKAKPYEPGTVATDPSLTNAKVNDFLGNVGAGLYGTFSQRFYVGFSVPRIYSNVIGFPNDGASLLAKEYQHFYGMAGAILPLSEDINLMPAVLVKYVQNTPFDADINVNLDIRQKFTAGISYRLGGDGIGESVDLLAYWQATPQMGVGASYDFTLSSLKDQQAGGIEVLFQTDLKKKKRKMSNPRFFM